MRQQSLKMNYMLSTLYQILKIICPIITAPYIARVLGPEGIGIYSYTYSYQAYFAMVASLGTINYGAREIARARDSLVERSRLFWEIELLTCVTTGLSLAGWCIWIVCNTQYKIYYIILSLFILANVFDISWFFTGIEQFKYTVAQNSLFKILGVILMLTLVKAPEDLWKYVLIMSGTMLCGNISMWIYLPQFITKVSVREINVFKHLRGTLVFFIPTIATSVYTILDKTLIGLLTNSSSENGYYEQAIKVVGLAQAVTFSGLNSVLYSRISYLFAQKKHEEIRDRIGDSIDFIMFMGLGGSFGIIGVATHFVPAFYGPGYERTVIILQLLSVLLIIQGISNCLGAQYFNPAGLRALSAKLIIVGSIVNLILNLLLIPKYWGLGAAIASVFAELTIMILYIIYSRGFIYTSIYINKGRKKLIAAIIMCVSVYGIGLVIENHYIATVVQVVIGSCIYILLLFLLKDSFVFGFVLPRVASFLKRGKSS